MQPVVWSERDEPNGAPWRDCTYSAGLMALVHAGELDYPLGIYTVAERQALERADSRPDETGANAGNLDEAIRVRYNRTLRRATLPLAQLLQVPNLAVIVPGSLGAFPAGHMLRRWDPAFTGGHRLTILTGPGGPVVRWLDPLAPWKFEGDEVYATDVVKFNAGYPADELRYTVADEFTVQPEPEPEPAPPADPEPAPVGVPDPLTLTITGFTTRPDGSLDVQVHIRPA